MSLNRWSRIRTLMALSWWLPLVAWAQVGSSEAALTKAYGKPTAREMENVMVKGKLLPSFPKLTYQFNDTMIVAVLVSERCAKITYDKDGLWPEPEYARVLAENAQGADWSDDPKGGKLREVSRKWIRSDGATAHWRKNLGLTVITPAYLEAEAAVKDRARNHLKVLPKD